MFPLIEGETEVKHLAGITQQVKGRAEFWIQVRDFLRSQPPSCAGGEISRAWSGAWVFSLRIKLCLVLVRTGLSLKATQLFPFHWNCNLLQGNEAYGSQGIKGKCVGEARDQTVKYTCYRIFHELNLNAISGATPAWIQKSENKGWGERQLPVHNQKPDGMVQAFGPGVDAAKG